MDVPAELAFEKKYLPAVFALKLSSINIFKLLFFFFEIPLSATLALLIMPLQK